MRKSKANKQCARCGWHGTVARAQRRCRQQRFGPRSAWCGGSLVDVASNLTPSPDELRTGAVVRAIDPREQARQLLAKAQEKVDYWIDAVASDTKKANRYAKQAALSDAEVEALRARARMAATTRKPSRRGIRVAGGLG